MFLYSVILCRKIDNILDDQGMEQEPLVALPFAHANQSLVNLILTGRAVPNVWDGVQDMGGLVLKGVEERSDVGFLTKLEALSYCKVGLHLKKPRFPLWVIGSETHLTLLFSMDLSVCVEEETPVQRANALFLQHDVEGNGFILPDQLAPIMKALNFDCSPGYVESLRRRIDADGMGILLLSNFLAILFPNAVVNDDVKRFEVFHYNGICRPGGKVQYVHGVARTAPPMDISADEIDRVMRTRWPTLQLTWDAATSIA
jgi:hypothetical protein